MTAAFPPRPFERQGFAWVTFNRSPVPARIVPDDTISRQIAVQIYFDL
jgi:hypothetical protein